MSSTFHHWKLLVTNAHLLSLTLFLLKRKQLRYVYLYIYLLLYILLSDFYRPWNVKNIHPICDGLVVGVERVILRMPVFALSLAPYTCISYFDYIHVQSHRVVAQRANIDLKRMTFSCVFLPRGRL